MPKISQPEQDCERGLLSCLAPSCKTPAHACGSTQVSAGLVLGRRTTRLAKDRGDRNLDAVYYECTTQRDTAGSFLATIVHILLQ